MKKQITLPDFLTEDQIDSALAIYREHKGTGNVAKLIASKVIEPNMKTINEKLGQENDAMYLAYACEYVFGETE
jgi:hypothetical protein